MERVRLIVETRKRRFGFVRKLLSTVTLALWARDRIRDLLLPRRGRYDYRTPSPVELYSNICIWIDKNIGWPKLPPYLGLAVLLGERVKLRQANLVDTSAIPTLPQPEPQAKGIEYLRQRMPEGTFNDLRDPRMGAAN